MKIKAIVLGIVTGIVASIVFSMALATVVGFFAGARWASQGLPVDQMQARVEAEMQELHAELLVFMLIVGLASTVLGGYVAGRIAKQQEVIHGVLMALFTLIVSYAISLLTTSTEVLPIWYVAGSCVGTLPSGALGGYLAQRRRLRREVAVVEVQPSR